MTVVVDFVSRHTTAPFIMRSLPPARGTNPNITIVLEDITGPALKREGSHSGTTGARGRMCTIINVDGVVIHLEVSIETFSDFETPRQQMPSSMLGILTNIQFNSLIVLAALLALSALKIELLTGFLILYSCQALLSCIKLIS